MNLAYPVLWYMVISIVGWMTFPLTFRLLPRLADRGYAASRSLGLLLWGYAFWLLTSLGILRNTVGGLLFALALLVAASTWALRSMGVDQLRNWWRSQRRFVLAVEVLFLAAFAGYAVIRAANPEAAGTEKPMELAFINAILRSPTFPPHDPWLSGYAISYYYFGYVIVAMLAKITGAPGSMAFNLGIITVFALTAAGSYGLLYNLLAHFFKREPSRSHPGTTALDMSASPSSLTASILAPLYILIVSNLEGFLHVLHNRGLFWQVDAAGNWTSRFWQWLDIEDLKLPPAFPLSWIPERFWWWWRASRVVQDYDLAGQVKEIIDEFPFFSYLLADLHPHVLAMPFAFLAMTLALNVLLGGGSGRIGWLQRRINLRTIVWLGTLAFPLGVDLLVLGMLQLNLVLIMLSILLLILGGFLLVRVRSILFKHGVKALFLKDLGEVTIGTPLQIGPTQFLLGAVVLGGMVFLNTWDAPVYILLYATAYALGRMERERAGLATGLMEAAWMVIMIGVSSVILYLPFYLSFSSQAGGILPNLIYPTRGAHLWVMFAPLLLPIFALLYYLAKQKVTRKQAWLAMKITIGLIIFLLIATVFLALVIIMIPEASEYFQSTLASQSVRELFQEAVLRRLHNPGGWLTLVGLVALTLMAFLGLVGERAESMDGESGGGEGTVISDPQPAPDDQRSTPHLYVLLLISLGILLVLAPEFFYLRDQFGWRMNTIFKFYFQAWLLWGLAAAYGSAILLITLRRSTRVLFTLGWSAIFLMGLFYPILSLWNKTNGFMPVEWTLDSTFYLERDSPEEMAAIGWLQRAPLGVVAEAVAKTGGSYTNYARVATLSGQPGVLGWIGHESQWRGGGIEMGSRQSDLERLYCSRDWTETQAILEQYKIRYIFVGFLEFNTYQPNNFSCPVGVMETKFLHYLNPVFQQGQVTIYEHEQNP